MSLNLLGMAEATRLTRAGRLLEALALLQGRCHTPRSRETSEGLDRKPIRTAHPDSQVVDMVPPGSRSDHRTAPNSDLRHASGAVLTEGLPQPHISEPVRGFIERFRPSSSPDLRGVVGRRARDGRKSLPDGARFEVRTFTNRRQQNVQALHSKPLRGKTASAGRDAAWLQAVAGRLRRRNTNERSSRRAGPARRLSRPTVLGQSLEMLELV